MLSASRVNGDLKDTYEELGALVLTALEKNELKWDNLRAQALVEKIKKSEEHLQEMEKEVQGIKAEKRSDSSNV